jgi:hypothetical protein
MQALFQADRHHPLPQNLRWDPEGVKAWLTRWGTAALTQTQQRAITGGFPLHPRDDEDLDAKAPTTLYNGALGVWLALERLQQSELLTLPPIENPAIIYQALHQNYLQQPDTGVNVPSWFLGESALLTQLCLHPQTPTDQRQEWQDLLFTQVHSNLDHPSQEILWGAPGTFLAALFLWEATAEKRWRELCQAHINKLWEQWTWFDDYGAWLWEQDLYGKKRIFLGAGHGWASNLYGLWRAETLLSDPQYNQLRERTLSGVKTLAISHAESPEQTHAGAINWPALASQLSNPQPADMMMQWCHGAPGIICALQRADLPELDAWLYKGGLSILEAGAVNKGASLCHGTAGNGYALLYLHQRLKSKLPAHLPSIQWLEHARRFGMYALQQSMTAYADHGDWHYSLWTGDAGLACFLLDCLEEHARLPGIDSF